MFPNRILYAADGSAESERARERVVDLVASRSGAPPGTPACELHVLHVALLSAWTGSKTMSPDQLGRVRSEGQEVLDAQVAALTAAEVEPTAVHLALGREVDEVLRLRDRVAADLIVLGSRGRNAFTRVLLGSDAESIVRHAPCSVLVVREDA